MSILKKWKLLSKKDVSPSPHFPLEKRSYQLPNGRIVDDFYLTTLTDSVHVIPITLDGKIIMIQMYKQGTDDLMIQTPAGRFDRKHTDVKDTAVKELEEEAGIQINKDQLIEVGKLALGSTKATEIVHYFAAKDVSFNSKQSLDANEEIEVLTLTPAEIEEKIASGQIYCSPTIAGWHLFKSKFPELLKITS